jgi:hypothetical protein
MTIGPRLTGQSGATPDSPMNFSRGALCFHESSLFVGRASLGTRHCLMHHRLVQSLIHPIFIGLAKGPFSLQMYMNFMHLRNDQLGKLVSP